MNKTELIITSPEQLRSLITESVSLAISKLPKPEPKPDIVYITRKQAADRLKISLPTLWKITREGKINSYRVASKVLYKVAEVDSVANQMNFKPKHF